MGNSILSRKTINRFLFKKIILRCQIIKDQIASYDLLGNRRKLKTNNHQHDIIVDSVSTHLISK
jgi:hypothetical protein